MTGEAARDRARRPDGHTDHRGTEPKREGRRELQILGLQRQAGNRATGDLVAAALGATDIDETLRDVRVHIGPEAAEATEREQALAFTRGTDIFFAPGLFEPTTREGSRLLAHELAHVLQQSRGVRSHQRESPHTLEREADRVASAMVDGAPSPEVVSGAAPGGIQRQAVVDPEKENIRRSLVAVPESWVNFADSPKFREALDENPLIRQQLQALPEFREWVRDPAKRPAKWVSAPDPHTEARETPAAQQAAEEAPVFSEFPALRPAGPPPPPHAAAHRRKTAQEAFRESFERTATLKQKGEAKIPVRPREFYGRYERAADELAAETKGLIGAAFPIGGTLAWDTAEFVTGETATNRPVDRLEKSKDVLLGTANVLTFFLPEGRLAEGIGGGKSALQEGSTFVPSELGPASEGSTAVKPPFGDSPIIPEASPQQGAAVTSEAAAGKGALPEASVAEGVETKTGQGSPAAGEPAPLESQSASKAPATTGAPGAPAQADPLVVAKVQGPEKGQFWPEGTRRFSRNAGTATTSPSQKYAVLPKSQAEVLGFRPAGSKPDFTIKPRMVKGELAESLGAGRRTGHPITARATKKPLGGAAPQGLELPGGLDELDPYAVHGFSHNIGPDIAQAQAYNMLIDAGELGILRPGNVSTGGVDAITAEVSGGKAKVYLNDVTAPDVRKVEKPSHADWAAELKEAVGEERLAGEPVARKRLDFKNKEIEDAIQLAIKNNEVYVRTVRVETSGTSGAPILKLGTPVKLKP